MMKFKTLIFLSTMAVGVASLTSCKTEGCTDADATNFNSDADTDDGSCTFEGEAVLWYGSLASEWLVDDDAITLTYRVDGDIVGSTAASVFNTSTPDCGDNGSITISKDLGGDKSESYSYSIKDQSEWEYWSGTLKFEANTCTQFELTKP